MTIKRSCVNCGYFNPTRYLDVGECRRYPPVIVDGEPKFPHVDVSDWCGEIQYSAVALQMEADEVSLNKAEEMETR